MAAVTNPLMMQPLHTDKPKLGSVVSDLGVTPRSPAVMRDGGLSTTTTSEYEARVLTLDEYKEAAFALAEAFKEDHTSLYFTHTPDRSDWSDQQKWELHVKMMEYITYAHLLKGLVVCAGPNYDCVGLWMPPGQNMDDYYTILRSGLWRLSYQLSREGRKRFFDEFLPLLTDTKAQVLGPRDDDAWYLVYIGTRPGSRGKGYARSVLSHVIKQADEERRPCYLESSLDINKKIYGKYGFEVRKEIYLQRGQKNVRMDIMVREPVKGSADSGVDLVI